jgi:hypothetical protein
VVRVEVPVKRQHHFLHKSSTVARVDNLIISSSVEVVFLLVKAAAAGAAAAGLMGAHRASHH